MIVTKRKLTLPNGCFTYFLRLKYSNRHKLTNLFLLFGYYTSSLWHPGDVEYVLAGHHVGLELGRPHFGGRRFALKSFVFE